MLSFTQKPVYAKFVVTDDMKRQSLRDELAHVNMLTVAYAQAFGYDDGWTPASEAADRLMALLLSDTLITSRDYLETMIFAANVCADLMDTVAPDAIDLDESFALWEMALAADSEALAAREAEAV